MVKGVFDELARPTPKNHFTVGIKDDVTFTSLDYDPEFSTEVPGTVRALFYGLGADGTVGANKNSIKIIGEETDNFAQGYFVYDSKKSGAITISHLRFGPRPLRSSYLITKASFVACHQFSFLERIDMLKAAEPGATFLLNSTYGPDEVWDHLPRTRAAADHRQEAEVLRHRRLRSRQEDRHGRPHQHHHADLLLRHQRRAAPRRGHRGHQALHREDLRQARRERGARRISPPWTPRSTTCTKSRFPKRSRRCSIFARRSRRRARFRRRRSPPRMCAGEGDDLPVSAMPIDGTFPTATAQWEKRNIALEIPVWDEELCIQCGKCVLVCPHAVIRAKVYDAPHLEGAPATFKSVAARWKDMKDRKYTLQVAPEDCTGCTLVRGGLPGEEQERSEAPRHQHGAAAAHPRSRSRELGLLPEASARPTASPLSLEPGEGRAVAPAAVRILRRLLGLRRNALHQAADAALRRPHC